MKTAPGETVLTFVRVVNAPRTLVWRAWTDPKHAAQWWGPDGCTTPVFEADLRPGGRLRIDMDHDGDTYSVEGVYEEVVEPERVVHVGRLERDGMKLFDARMAVTFEEDGGKTTITVRQTLYNLGARAGDALAGAQEGWKQHFDRLEEYLRRRG
jgi:uncharacterized protein YndB with AHSA1/START domain